MGDEGYGEGYEEGYYEEGYDEGYYDEGYYDEGYYEEGYDEGYNEAQAAEASRQGYNRPPPPTPPKRPGQQVNEQGYTFVALYDYTASNPEELSFRVGDEITVLSQAKEGWFNAVFNGRSGYVPSNYMQIKENEEEALAAKKARRQKMMMERNELRERVDEKRTRRKQLEEEVRALEKANRERKALLKKLANPADDPEFFVRDLNALAIQMFLVDRQQARYAELSTSLMLGLSSLQGQLNNEALKADSLKESKKQFDEQINLTKQAFTNAGENLNQLIRTRKEFVPVLETVRTKIANTL